VDFCADGSGPQLIGALLSGSWFSDFCFEKGQGTCLRLERLSREIHVLCKG
jgi:hypothetical protein